MINQDLINFIKQSMQKGNTKDKISSDLLSNGWNDSDISEGFNAVSELEKQNSTSSKITSPSPVASQSLSSALSTPTSVSAPASVLASPLSTPDNSINLSSSATHDISSNVYHPVYQKNVETKNIWNYVLAILIIILVGFVYTYSDILFRSLNNNPQDKIQNDDLFQEQNIVPENTDKTAPNFEELPLIDETTKTNTNQNTQENTQTTEVVNNALPYQVSFESPSGSIKAANGEKLSLKIKTGDKIKSVKVNFFVSYKSGKNDLKEIDILTKDGYAEYVYITPSSSFKSIDVIAEGTSDNKKEQSQADSKLSEEQLLERFLTVLPLI